MKIKMFFLYLILICNIISINFYNTSFASNGNLSILNFYVGQNYWDVYENIKSITGTDKIPTTINYYIEGFYTVFDKNLKLVRIAIPINALVKSKNEKFNIDDAKYITESILKNFDNDKSNIKINYIETQEYNSEVKTEIYSYTQKNINFVFSVNYITEIVNNNKDKYATFGPIIFGEIIPPTGPVIKKLQLGQPIYEAQNIIKENNLQCILNKTINIGGASVNNDYISEINLAPFVMAFGFSGKNMQNIFGVDNIDDDFINKFITAYGIDGNFISYEDFCVSNNISGDYIEMPNGYDRYHSPYAKIFEGNDFYVFFTKRNTSPPIWNGVYIIYKAAIPFASPKIPPYNKPKFD